MECEEDEGSVAVPPGGGGARGTALGPDTQRVSGGLKTSVLVNEGR